jgi:hypothetical protein
MQQNPSSVPSKRGSLPNFSQNAVLVCAHTGQEVLRWRTRAAILKRSWSRNFACAAQRSTRAVLFRLAMVGTVATPSSRTDPPITCEGSWAALHTSTGPAPTRRSANLAPCCSSGSFVKILSLLPGPHAVGPQILSFEGH